MPNFDIDIPKKKPNVNLIMQNLFLKIKRFFILGNNHLTFEKLIPSESKEDKVATFIPLLHLANRHKIDINQEKPFGDIEIYLKTNKDLNLELQKIET